MSPRGQYGRGRRKSVGHRCPGCNRILLPWQQHWWPAHFIDDIRCPYSNTPYPKAHQ